MANGKRAGRRVAASALLAWSTLAMVPEAAHSQMTRPAPAGVWNIRDYGAAADGRTLDTAAINKAIEACAMAGGGQVLFPPGAYLSGTVHLKSRVVLKLEAGSRLVGTPDLTQYQQFTPPEGTPEARGGKWHRALILADGVEDAAIAGEGVIDGNKVFDPRGEEKMRGPHTIILGNSRNVTIRDVEVRDSANYAIMIEFSSQVDVRRVKVTGGWDGVHFRGWKDKPCRNLSIVGCQFFTGDDSIAGRYAEDLLISDCVINSSCNGMRIIGPCKGMIVHGCLFYGPGLHPHRTQSRHNMLSGIILQPGGWDVCDGELDDVLISDVTMKNVASPITIQTKRAGNTVDRVTVSRLSATGVYRSAASVESWSEVPIGRVVFRDVAIEYVGGGKGADASAGVKPVGLDSRALPVWGFFARNTRDLSLENVRLGWVQADMRPVLVAQNVGRLNLDGLRFPRAEGADAPVALEDVEKLDLRDAGMALAEPRCTAIKLAGEGRAARIVAGKPFSATVAVENAGQEGLARIELAWADQKRTRWVYLPAGGKSEVVFRDLPAPAAGTHEVRSGGLTEKLVVEP